MKNYILGISAYYHDSAAALIENGIIIAAAQEERFTRVKNDASFPSNAIKYCLEYSGKKIDDLTAVVFYDKPFLKFERLLETYYATAPKGLKSFIMAIPVWLDQKLFLKRSMRQNLARIHDYDKKKLKIFFSEHHLSHAASAFFPSGFDEAAILTIDGVGEWSTASIAKGSGREITVLKELHFPHSIGLLYSSFTYYLGFKVNSGEYKLMGLAPYGNSQSDQYRRFKKLIEHHLITSRSDGSVFLHQEYFSYATGYRMVNEKMWKALFDLPRRLPESQIDPDHCNLALAIQHVTEDLVLKMAVEAKRLTGMSNLCLAGGVALNCVSNWKLQKAKVFNNIYIQPAAGDAGGSVGSALALAHIQYKVKKEIVPESPYLGPEYSSLDIRKAINRYNLSSKEYDNNELCLNVAQLISEGNVIGWFQGRMEFGPRALGSRSILADPRNPEIQKRLNEKIKFRESFRPFAPSVLAEEAEKYFDLDAPSPYMLLVSNVRKEIQKKIPEDYDEWGMWEKLYFVRSSLPAITHIDFTARVQTVTKEINPKYWELINEFKNLTGIPILINTSFNVRGEPIVCTPEDALNCFQATQMDYLAIGNFLVNRVNDQLP